MSMWSWIKTKWQELWDEQRVKDAQWQWWEKALAESREEGRRDAEQGTFQPPQYDIDDDPTESDLYAAYEEGFKERRRELGPKFSWK